jgi:beta-lactamase regulating signal transducer with metallopeptidase domain
MNALIATLNQWGASFLHGAGAMLWQSSLLAVVILLVDFGLRQRVRASVRHGLWLVLLVKLILPPAFALPTSPAWWWSRRVPEAARRSVAEESPAEPVVTQDNLATPQFNPPMPLPAPAPCPPLTLAGWGLLMAAAGSLGLLLFLGLRYAQVLRLGRLAEEAPELEQLMTEARQLAGLRVWVRVKISPDTMSPAVCGLFRPVILLPQSLVEILSPEQVRAVLVHELMHVRRGDVWVNCAQGLLQIVYWWHPLVWLANARIRRVREEAVDDAVMVALRADAEIYAPTLLAVARFALRCPLASLGLVGILESRSALRQRIERLVNLPVPARAGLSFVSLFGLLLFSAVALPMGDAPPPVPMEMAQTFPPPVVFQDDPLIPSALAAPESIPPNADKTPWPDHQFEGYQSINLRADFFILDESELRAKVPALGNAQAPVAIGPDEVDDLVTHLKQAGARFFNNYEEGIDVPGISGTSQHYRIGGFLHRTGTAEFTTTNIDGRSMISGTEISLPARQPDWTPVDFTVRPWQQDDRIRCELTLGTGEPPQHFQSAELTIIAGGALAWMTTASVKPGKCQVVFLMSWNTNDSLPSATFQHRRIPLDNGFQSFVDDQLGRNWRNPAKSIWRGANDWGRRDEDLVYPLLHEAGLNWLPPRRLTYNYFDSLEVYAPAKDVKVIEAMVGKISKTYIQNDITNLVQAGKLSYENGKLDEAERALKLAIVWDPTNAGARYYLDQIAQARKGGRPAPTPPRSESHSSGTRLISLMLTGNVGLPQFRYQTGLTSGNSPEEYLAVFRKLLASRGASLPTNSLWLRDQGSLLVRGSPRELTAVESMFEELNRTQRLPQTAAAARPAVQAGAAEVNQPSAVSAGVDTNLYLRTFKVNTNILEKTFTVMGGSLSARNQSTNFNVGFRDVFKAMGVDLKPPEASFYNDRLGLLFIRATSGDLDMVERIVESLNQDGPLDDRPFDTTRPP